MHVTPVDALRHDHHRTILTLTATALAAVLGVAGFVVVDEVTSSGGGRSRSAPAEIPEAPAVASVLRDGAAFNAAVADAVATITGGAPPAPATSPLCGPASPLRTSCR